MSHESATKAILTLLACYPNTKADEKFVKMAAMSLAHYSDDTLKAMIDPKSGIVNDHPYMPSISHMKDFCKNYCSVPQQRTYLTFPEPVPASPESKAKIDSILATMPWAGAEVPLKLTEEELEALKEKYATLAPPRLSEAAKRALKEKEEFRALYGKKMPN